MPTKSSNPSKLTPKRRCLRCNCYLRDGNLGAMCGPCKRVLGDDPYGSDVLKRHWKMMDDLAAERFRLLDKTPWLPEETDAD